MNNPIISLPQWVYEHKKSSATAQTPSWLSDAREKNWHALLQTGFPTRKHERFKYADFSYLQNKQFHFAKKISHHKEINELKKFIARYRTSLTDHVLIVSVNGYFMPELSDLNHLPQEVIVRAMDELTPEYHALIQKNMTIDARNHPFAALNTALTTSGIFCYVPKQCHLTKPIRLLSIAMMEQEFIHYPHHIFIFDTQSTSTLIEDYLAFHDMPHAMSSVMHVLMHAHAQVNYCKIQEENNHATHVAHTFIQQHEKSKLDYIHFSLGAHCARDELVIRLQEQEAECSVRGFYYVSHDQQYNDQHIDIQHLAPGCRSDMLYKGILKQQSRAVFDGKLYVNKDAQKTLAYQANHNLLLSDHAEVFTKPALEIYAHDIKCKHGATSGQLNAEALFYLRARGISYDDATKMLIHAFAHELINSTKHVDVQSRIASKLSCM